jgi:hypothetical protein
MKMPSTFFCDNPTGTMADPLRAIGLAEVLASWLQVCGKPVVPMKIHDYGDYYRIELPAPIEEADITQTPRFMAGRALALGSKKQQERAAKAGRDLGKYFDYDAEIARRDAFRERLAKMSPQDQQRIRAGGSDLEQEGIVPPHEDLSLYICLNHFKIADTYNALLARWQGVSVSAGASLQDSDNNTAEITDELDASPPTQEGDASAFQENLALLFRRFSQHPNAPLEGKGATTTLLQVVNPSTGKGANAPKANALGIGNLGGHWLDEYLKLIGFFTIAAPILISKVKDRKTYALRPREIRLDDLRTVMRDFRRSFYGGTALKADILASLQFTRTFVSYCQGLIRAETVGDPLLARFGKKPTVRDISTGFDIAFYKDMRSAFATMNLATINFPDWLRPLATLNDADVAAQLLDEHIKVIQSIRSAKKDEGSEEIELLRDYRDFLSGHDVRRFFTFAARFGDYYLGHRHRNLWINQFTTEGMEHIMEQARTDKDKGLARILKDEGFREIAAAIRRATVGAQYQAARESGYPFEVRYGLGQQLLRAAAYPEDFISALSEFLHSYNAENARIDERIAKGSLQNIARNRRARVTTASIDAITALIDAHGSEVVCKMLVAYGYARDPKTPEQAPPPDGAGQAEDQNLGDEE